MTPEPRANALSDNPSRDFGTLQPFSLRFSERKILLGFVDVSLLNLAFFTTLQLRAADNAAAQLAVPHGWFLFLSVAWLICAWVIGCYDLVRAASIKRSIGLCAAAMGALWTMYWLASHFDALPLSRLDMALFSGLGLVALSLWRIAYATVFAHPNFQQRALVIGAGFAGRTLARTLAEMGRNHRKAPHDDTVSGISYHILGFIDDAVAPGSVLEGVPVVGTRHEIPDLLHQLQINELVVAITRLETMHVELFELIQQCRTWGVSITTMADLYERLTGRVPIEHVGHSISVAMPIVQPPMHRFYLMLQRAVDIVGSLFGCLVLLLLMPMVWLANRIASPGPLFYHQERVGKGGRTFNIVKFRSMRVDAEKLSGVVWAAENDPRITPVGNFLRKTRLDEIPQFWNILKGDMSLIGPRPERPHFVAQLTREIPFYRVRHAVKPGLTGWAQVRYRYGASVEDSLIKLQYDLFYIKRQSVLLDLEIVFKTIPIILGFKGR